MSPARKKSSAPPSKASNGITKKAGKTTQAADKNDKVDKVLKLTDSPRHQIEKVTLTKPSFSEPTFE